ncbi:MAG: cation:proton antiporter [Parachlamydiaceae bacterium]|nr:cation:proton antiporter [Parachlamydiaceae bacterium]
MDHNLGIVIILTVGFALASFLSYIAQRLKLSPILGYLLAGYIIGPYSPGFVADSEIAEQLAEIGVILMLFGVGLHFKIEDLIKVKNIAIIGAVGQTTIATVTTMGIVSFAGWRLEFGLIMGLAIGVASTVVLMRMLIDNHLLITLEGHIAIGWLIVEDIFTVIILILLPTLAILVEGSDVSTWTILQSMGSVLIKFTILAIFMFTWGHKIVSYILTNIARLHSGEMFTLGVLALVFVIAIGSTLLFGISIALGAFIAGMVIGKTQVRHQAAANALPLKDIFGIIFFLSVGMIFNPQAIALNYSLFFGLLAVILIIKPLSAYLITIFLGYPLKVALVVAFGLAQIGEFSFILAEEALKFKLLSDEGYDFLVACALVSISINPLLFGKLDFFESILRKISRFPEKKENQIAIGAKEKDHFLNAVIVGFGPIGKAVSIILNDRGFSPLIIENNIDIVSRKDEGDGFIFGDASEASILKEAHLEKVSHLLITITDSKKAMQIIKAARQINPGIEIIARAQFISEESILSELKVRYICSERSAIKEFISLTRHLFSSNL